MQELINLISHHPNEWTFSDSGVLRHGNGMHIMTKKYFWKISMTHHGHFITLNFLERFQLWKIVNEWKNGRVARAVKQANRERNLRRNGQYNPYVDPILRTAVREEWGTVGNALGGNDGRAGQGRPTPVQRP